MKKAELKAIIREEIQSILKEKEEAPETYVSKTAKGFTLIHKGIPVMSSDRTMNDVEKMAKKMKLTISPKL